MWRVGALALIVVALAGCGGSAASSSGSKVVAAFYPLAWAAQRIGGPGARVVNLTPPGAEPHDIELTPSDVGEIRDADLVIYLGSGFQPAVENAVRDRNGPSLDVLGSGKTDPHIWLDPVRFAAVVRRIGRALGRPARGRELAAQIEMVGREYRNGLARCKRRTIVTTHAAFGYLSSRYGLRQLALTGISPEAEPTPRRLEQLIGEVRRSGASTVFKEPLVLSRTADTVARATGAKVAVLDPIEGLSKERIAAGEDYVSVMRQNLAALRVALACR